PGNFAIQQLSESLDVLAKQPDQFLAKNGVQSGDGAAVPPAQPGNRRPGDAWKIMSQKGPGPVRPVKPPVESEVLRAVGHHAAARHIWNEPVAHADVSANLLVNSERFVHEIIIKKHFHLIPAEEIKVSFYLFEIKAHIGVMPVPSPVRVAS